MAIVEMKCPNCGSSMQLKDGQFFCPSCRTMMLHIIDAKIDADVSVISPEEFQKKLEESKKSYIIKLESNVKVFDVDTEIINARIKNASVALENGEFGEIFGLLEGVSNKILSAERLRFLAKCEVKSESDFVYGANINQGKEHFDNIINQCDTTTRETYLKIASICEERYTRERETEKKIGKAAELVTVGQFDSAFTYSQQICKEDPTNPFVWAWMAMMVWKKAKKSPDYEFVKMYQALSLMDDIRYNEYLERIVCLLILGRKRWYINSFRWLPSNIKSFLSRKYEYTWTFENELKYQIILSETKWVSKVQNVIPKNFIDCWINFNDCVMNYIPDRNGHKTIKVPFQFLESVAKGDLIVGSILLPFGVFVVIANMIPKFINNIKTKFKFKKVLKLFLKNNVRSPIQRNRYYIVYGGTDKCAELRFNGESYNKKEEDILGFYKYLFVE